MLAEVIHAVTVMAAVPTVSTACAPTYRRVTEPCGMGRMTCDPAFRIAA